ncbi:response regulator transcription factor [Bacillus sp. NPDC077027]|uniref:response regulator transcription factor n=1 Tax=Bacillus sp. NPDC077027 TaxID=3390548 RepID=UPI003D073876
MKVLIADDEKIERLAMRKFITEWLPECKIAGEAENGKKAVDLAINDQVDLVIMDIQMPGMNGLTAIQHIKKQRPQTKFIMLTAYDTFDYARQAMREGVKQYLVKPAEKEETIAAIRSVLTEMITEQERLQESKAYRQRKWLEAQMNQVKGYDECDDEFNLLFSDFESGMAIAVGQLVSESFIQYIKQKGNVHLIPFQSSSNVMTCFLYSNQSIGQLKAEILQTIRSFYTCHDSPDVIGLGSPVSRPAFLAKSLAEAKLSYRKRKEKGAVQYGFYHAQIERMNLVTLSELADHIMQALEEGKREEAIAYYDDFQMEGATLSHLKELLVLLKSRVRVELNIFSIRSLYECRQKCLYMLDIYEVRSEVANKIERAKRYIQAHFCENMTLEKTAAYVNLSPTYFTKRFKDETGLTFIEFVTHCRLEKMKKLLKETSLSLKEITYQTGYTDPNYVSRVFKKTVGLSPKEYRKQVIRK